MGKINKGVSCSIKGCENPAIRSISFAVFNRASIGLSLKERSRTVYLCKEHYKLYKKQSKKHRTYEKWRIWKL